ncbi:PRC-barrel domain containing protein [Streptomyces sp. NBC_01232]|uniref:PRC-barrel domain containing protein n=1 Tax=unclassified Streptomyces TaxID=2593676 RepID=UPI002E0D6C0D|nr:PRC-barrel domain containing protein [Streptomyces sp. NBC_01232]
MSESAWAYRITVGRIEGVDLSGFKVEAVDGSIGKVDKHSDEVGSAYLLVDTGPWIFGKEVLLPASTVTGIDVEEERIHVGLTKEQIKDAPEFVRDEHLQDTDYRNLLGGYYGLIPHGWR